MKIEIVRYDASQLLAWEELLGQSKNGLFLFDRGYMDYHADRFVDFSAIAYIDGKPSILCPASFANDGSLATSHGGLTFGGFVVSRCLRSEMSLAGIDRMLDSMKQWGAKFIAVRVLPSYLCTTPSGEVEFALGRRNLAVNRRDLCSLLSLDRHAEMSKNKARDISRARKLGIAVGDCSIAEFYPLLEQVLRERHGTSPVHSLAELQLLHDRFPDCIVARVARLDGEPIAGAIIYRYGHVSHTQYLAAPDVGRKTNALDLVIGECIDLERAAGSSAFSFGTSMNGGHLNEGLLWQKESFGARSALHYTIAGPL